MSRDSAEKRAAAIAQFNQHRHSADGERVVEGLESGLILLRDLFYQRMHFDVERVVGADSMLVPISESRTQQQTKREIDWYQVIESAWAVRTYQFDADDGAWYLNWLGALRLGEAFADAATATEAKRAQVKTPDERRLAFMDTLLRILPESNKAPLVLFRLFPMCVHLATALAFGDQKRAKELRQQQKACLPAIADCHECRGGVLDNGDFCGECGSPLWKFEWLTVTD